MELFESIGSDILAFWDNFWSYVKKKIDEQEQKRNTKPDVVEWANINDENPLDVVVKKLNTLVNDEATFNFESDSTLTEPLRALCDDLEAKRYEICSMMLGTGGCFVTMATNEDTEPYHRIIPQKDASIFKINADKIYEIALVIDRKKIKRQEYNLVRHHILDNNGTLWIYYYTLDHSGREAYVEEWEHFKNDNTAFYNANHIGVAYFKSPQDSNGNEPFFGVPFNYSCKVEEANYLEAKRMRRDEMSNAEMILFADESITLVGKDEMGRNVHKLPEKVYTIRKVAGVDGNLIDVHAPATRLTDYERNEIIAGHDYEDRMGLNPGFVTPAEYTAGATATEIHTANSKTIAMINKIHNAMYEGIKQTLIADNVLSLIPMDLWTLNIDWYDSFENPAEQWQRMIEAHSNGAITTERLTKWIFPNMTDEEIQAELESISATQSTNTDQALERILQGG